MEQPTQIADQPLSILHKSTLDLPEEEAFELWKTTIGQSYNVSRSNLISRLPRGGQTLYILDGIMVNRTVFGPQRAIRDRNLVANTPDSLVLQLWRTGGYRGEIDGNPIVLKRGHTVLANRRRELDVQFSASDTFGLVIPRDLLQGIDIDRLSTALDPVRDRLATARLRSLYNRLPQSTAADVPALSAELLVFVQRLLDPSRAPDVLHASELDVGIVELARRIFAANLDDPSLSPDAVAAQVGVSRATLYRAFASSGGVMKSIWDMRVDAIRAAMEDPHRRATLTQIAARHGFASLAHLSRTFRQRFGMSPRDWRQMHRDARKDQDPLSEPEGDGCRDADG